MLAGEPGVVLVDGCGLAQKSQPMVSELPVLGAAANLQTNVFQQEKSILPVPALACSCRSRMAALARRLRAPAAPKAASLLGRRLLCKPRRAGGVRVEAPGSAAAPSQVLQRDLSAPGSALLPSPPRPAVRSAPGCVRRSIWGAPSKLSIFAQMLLGTRGEPRHSFGDRAGTGREHQGKPALCLALPRAS